MQQQNRAVERRDRATMMLATPKEARRWLRLTRAVAFATKWAP